MRIKNLQTGTVTSISNFVKPIRLCQSIINNSLTVIVLACQSQARVAYSIKMEQNRYSYEKLMKSCSIWRKYYMYTNSYAS